MLSSYQIAAAIQQQNQMFSSAAQFSQQISAAVPQPMSGLGAFGGGQSGAQYPQMQGSANQQPGFQHGGGQGLGGYGVGNQMGAKAMSAIGGAGQAASGLLGVAAGFAPMSIGMAAMPVTAMAKHAFGSMVTGAQEQSNVDRVMGGMNFQNMASRTGRGFTRQDSAQIGDMMRSMSNIPEMLTSMGELSRITDKIIQTGQMQGIKDVNQFQRKWKEAVTQLKDVAKIMGTSMEGALPFLQEAKQSGLYNRKDIANNMYARQTISASTGMNQQQINQVQQMGSQMSFQRGGSRRTGTLLGKRMMENVGDQMQSGALSNEYLMEMTGAEGAEGAQALSAMRTDMAYRMSRSAVGTVAAMGLGEKKGGRFTGKMDMEAVEGVLEGRTSFGDVMGGARSKTGGRGSKISWARRKGQMGSEMAGALGPEGQAMLWQNILSKTAYKDDEDVQGIILQRHGFSDREAQDMLNSIRQLNSHRAEKNWNKDADKDRMRRQAYFRENFSADALKKKMHTRISNVITEPFKEIGVAWDRAIKDRVDNFMDDLTGDYRAELKQSTAGLISSAWGGDKTARARAQKLSGDSGVRGKGTWAGAGQVGGYASAGGGMTADIQRGYDWLSGRERPGVAMADTLMAMGRGASGEGGKGEYVSGLKAASSDSGREAQRQHLATRNIRILDERHGVFITQSEEQHKRARNNVEDLLQDRGEKSWSRFAQERPDDAKWLQTTMRQVMSQTDVTGLSDNQKVSKYAEAFDEGNSGAEMASRATGFNIGGGFTSMRNKAQMRERYGSTREMVMAMHSKAGGLSGAGIGGSTRGGLSAEFSDVSADPVVSAAKAKKLTGDLQSAISKKKHWKGQSFSDLKKTMDSNDPLVQSLIFGGENSVGIFQKPGSAPADVTAQKTLIDALQANPAEWTDEHKKALEKLGHDPKKLAAELERDPARRESLVRFANTAQGLGEAGEAVMVLDLASAEHQVGTGVIKHELAAVGRRMASSLTGEKLTTLAGTGKVGKKETSAQAAARKKFMGEYSAEATALSTEEGRKERLEAAKTGKMPYHLTSAAQALTQMSPEAQKLAQKGMDARSLAVTQDYSHARKLAGKRGATMESVMGGMYPEGPGKDEEGRDKSWQEKLGERKFGEIKKAWDTKGAGRTDEVAKVMAQHREAGLKAGGVQGNKYETEAKTADALKAFADAIIPWSAEVNSKLGGAATGTPGV